MLEINVETVQQVSVIRLIGEIDAATAVTVQETVLPLSVPDASLILEMTQVAYMSSAGLRMLLSVYRTISAKQGKVILVGLSSELTDTMSMTGFLSYFTVHGTLDEGLQAFAS
jgi:anti-sigma B factor antagonist